MKNNILLACLFFLSGCATVLQGSPDRVQVNSKPEGATVYLNGAPVGTTPMMVSISHSDDANIMIKKDGYDSFTLEKHKSLSGWVIADIIFWPSVIIDLATHNQGHYDDGPIFVELADKKITANPNQSSSEAPRAPSGTAVPQ